MVRRCFDTIPNMLIDNMKTVPDQPALSYKTGDKWITISWLQYYKKVRTLAASLSLLGLKEGDGVAILSTNRPAWFISHLASIWIKTLPTGLYPTDNEKQWAWILNHLNAKVVFVEDEEKLNKLNAVREELKSLQWIILFDGKTDLSKGVISYSDLFSKRDEILTWDETVEDRLDKLIIEQKPDDVAALIYTSGTTGNPKGAMLTHRNFCYMSYLHAYMFPMEQAPRFFSYLPLSHIGDMIITLYTPLMTQGTTYFATSIETFTDDLKVARPHIFLGVPRVFEKIADKIKEKEMQASFPRKFIFTVVKKIGLKCGLQYQKGNHGVKSSLSYKIADKLVFSKLKKLLGFDQGIAIFSAGAPLSVETAEYFLSLGIHLPQSYGLSETTGATAFTNNESIKMGYTGKAHGDFKIKTSSEGEILVRGSHIFKGYYKNPEETSEVLKEGWFYTGDLGKIDKDGFVKITGRKKELLVTAGGKNVAPIPIEKKMKEIEEIQDIVVIGDKKPYLTALITLDTENSALSAKSLGLDVAKCDLHSSEKFQKFLFSKVEAVNRNLGRIETVKRISILSAPFAVETGELTATLKLRRHAIVKKYSEVIEQLYKRK